MRIIKLMFFYIKGLIELIDYFYKLYKYASNLEARPIGTIFSKNKNGKTIYYEVISHRQSKEVIERISEKEL